MKQNDRGFQVLAKGVPVGIFQTDPKGNCSYVNKRWSEISGISMKNALNQGWVKSIHPKDRPWFNTAWKNCIKKGIPFYAEYRFKKNKGVTTWVLGQALPQKNKKGGIMGYIGTVTDISEKKKTERSFDLILKGISLAPEQKFLHRLVRFMASAFGVKWAFISELGNARGTRLRLLSFWTGKNYGKNFEYNTKGTPCQKVIGKKLCYFPDNIQKLFPSDDWLAENKIEGYMAVPLYSSRGKPLGHLGIMDDQPLKLPPSYESLLRIFGLRASAELEYKYAENEQNKTISLLKATLDSTADGILVVDNRGEFIRFNNRFIQMWKIPQKILKTSNDEQALAYVTKQLKYPKDFLARVRELYSQPDVESFDTIEFKNNKIFERYSQPQKVEGKTIGRVWSFRDVTDRRNAEKKILQLNETLERRVAQRTKQLKDSLYEKEILLKEIHHRVKNNLQVISSLLTLQESFVKNKTIRDFSEEFQTRIRSIALIHETLFKSENMAWINIKEYIQNLSEYLLRSFGTDLKKIRIQKNIHVNQIPVDTATPLGLIINELLSNALKYAFKKNQTGKIWILIEPVKTKKGIVLTIRDNGVGIPPDFDIYNSSTFGFKMILALADQLKGTLMIDRKNGSTIRISFNELKHGP